MVNFVNISCVYLKIVCFYLLRKIDYIHMHIVKIIIVIFKSYIALIILMYF